MVLPDGRVITGKTSDQIGASAALLLNALKALGGIDQELDLISTQVLEPICRLKTGSLGNKNPRLHSDEVLIDLWWGTGRDTGPGWTQKWSAARGRSPRPGYSLPW